MGSNLDRISQSIILFIDLQAVVLVDSLSEQHSRSGPPYWRGFFFLITWEAHGQWDGGSRE